MGITGTSHVNYPEIKTFSFAENKREATHPSIEVKRTVAQVQYLHVQPQANGRFPRRFGTDMYAFVRSSMHSACVVIVRLTSVPLGA